jgi:hypothetical protein
MGMVGMDTMSESPAQTPAPAALECSQCRYWRPAGKRRRWPWCIRTNLRPYVGGHLTPAYCRKFEPRVREGHQVEEMLTDEAADQAADES